MPQKTDSELLIEAGVIKNETSSGANTATRVGEILEDIIDSKSSIETTFVYDLSNGNYTMTSDGVYEFSNCDGGVINFPDPANFNGKKITIINTDDTNSIIINSNQPYWIGSNNNIGALSTYSMFIFVSINGVWRGGYLLD